jgi:hypothetical protein
MLEIIWVILYLLHSRFHFRRLGDVVKEEPFGGHRLLKNLLSQASTHFDNAESHIFMDDLK